MADSVRQYSMPTKMEDTQNIAYSNHFPFNGISKPTFLHGNKNVGLPKPQFLHAIKNGGHPNRHSTHPTLNSPFLLDKTTLFFLAAIFPSHFYLLF